MELALLSLWHANLNSWKSELGCCSDIANSLLTACPKLMMLEYAVALGRGVTLGGGAG